MKHVYNLVLAGVLIVSLGGFALPPPNTSGVSSAIQRICKVVPEVAGLIALIGVFPQGTAAATIAQAFCTALQTGAGGVASARGVVVVRGVPVAYTRIR